MQISMLRHPFGGRQMTLECPPREIGFMFRIKMQNYSCDFTPISTFLVGVEQVQIRDEVFLVVSGQHGIGGRGIGEIWIKRRPMHGRSRNVVDSTNFSWGSAAY